VNDEGYSPLLWGVHKALSQQMADVKKYREAVRSTHSFWDRPMATAQRKFYDFRYHFDQWVSSSFHFFKIKSIHYEQHPLLYFSNRYRLLQFSLKTSSQI
jgi:hypothetical protein